MRGTDCEVQVSKTTKKSYTPEFKMAVALEAIRGEKTLSQVASEHGVSPSLACEWRDQLVGSAGDEALRKIGQLTVERDFLQRFCDRNGYDPQKTR